MKLDKNYTSIKKCPVTQEILTGYEYAYPICPKCGHSLNSNSTHSIKVIGKWDRPTFFEILLGKKAKFIKKE